MWGNTQNSHRKKARKQTFYCLKYFIPDREGLQSMRITHVDQRENSVRHSWRWLPELPWAQSEIKKKLGRDRQTYAFNRFLQEVYWKVEWGHSLCWVTIRSWFPIRQGEDGLHCSLTGTENCGQMFKLLLFFEWQGADFLVGLQQWWVLVLQHRPSPGLRGRQQVRRRWAMAGTSPYTSSSEEHETKLKESFDFCLLYLLLLTRLETV